MIRFLNVLALAAVIASATWAYTVKYETILVAEKLRKREAELVREHDATAILKAEWQMLNRPARLQALAKPENGMQQISARQVARAADVPQAPAETGDKLESLLTGSIPPAPKSPASAAGAARTSAPPPKAKAVIPPAKKRAEQAKSGPIKLIPPGKIGPQPPLPLPSQAAAPASPPASAGSGLTGFLKKLLQ
jgi:hypothetical protein